MRETEEAEPQKIHAPTLSLMSVILLPVKRYKGRKGTVKMETGLYTVYIHSYIVLYSS